MEINSSGVVSKNLDDYLKFWTEQLKKKYGTDFTIKKEGVIDNLAVGVSALALDLESVILFMTKNLNPYTAEGSFQDYLYSLIGLVRRQATKTVMQRVVSGTPLATVKKGDIIFENKGTSDQFILLNDITLSEEGKAIGTFQAVELGAIEFNRDTECSIMSAPATINGIYYAESNITEIGLDYESDSEFRERWLQEQSLVVANTEGGIKKALLPYCNFKSNNIQIRMNRESRKFNDVPLHSMNIVVYSTYDDDTIARVIFDKIIDGVGLSGEINKEVVDEDGDVENILFSRAEEIGIDYQIKIVIAEGYQFNNTMQAKIIEAIKNNTEFSMGVSAVANKVIRFVDAIEGVDYVESAQVSIQDHEEWQDRVEISQIQVAKIGNINVSI